MASIGKVNFLEDGEYLLVNFEKIDSDCKRTAFIVCKTNTGRIYDIEISGSKKNLTNEKIELIFDILKRQMCKYSSPNYLDSFSSILYTFNLLDINIKCEEEKSC